MSRKMPIFYGALFLTGVNLLLRFVGTSFQVYLSSRIGAEGIGLLQLVMSVGSMALVAGMGGIRTATMYLTAEELGRKHPDHTVWVLSGCLLYSILLSTGVSLLVYYFAPSIARYWIQNVQCTDSIRLFSAFLPVNCLCGVMVGYFTGANRIGTLAAVEVMEQLCNMVCTVLLLSLWAGNDPVRSCQAVVIGSGVSACITLIALVILRLAEKSKTGFRIPLRSRLCQTAIPLALADDLRTGISTVENLMVPQRLALYQGSQTPLAAFGTVCGMVFPVLMLPAALLFGLTELLIPELARCNVTGSVQRIRYLAKQSLKVALLFGSFCALLLFLTASELCKLLYHSSLAGTYLKWFAPLAVMLYCDALTDAMIKGLGHQRSSVRYNICTNTLDVLFLYLLLPKFGMKGYYFSFLITHIINFGFSIRKLLKITHLNIQWHIPLLCIASACLSAWICHIVLSPGIRAVAAMIIFTCLLILMGILRKEDALWLQKLIKAKNRPT